MNPALLAGALAACLLLAAPQAIASPPQIDVVPVVDFVSCVRIVWEEFPYVFLDECGLG